MVTVFSNIEKKAAYLKNLKIKVGEHTKYLKRKSFFLFCSIEKIGDTGESVQGTLGYNSWGTASATYKLKCGRKSTEFNVPYSVYNY